MPHKRAKRSIRLEETAKKGVNLPPSSSSSVYDDTPRSASRIINGWATQKAFRESGRVSSEDTGERKPKLKPKPKVQEKAKSSSSTSTVEKETTTSTKGKEKAFSAPKILPHESLGEYNRRVESLLRPEVNKAIRDAQNLKAAEESKAWKEKKERKKRAKIEKLVKEGKLDSTALVELDKKEKETAKGKRKRSNDDDDDEDEEEGVKGNKKERPMKEFASMPGPKRLNDIVQAPPTLPHLRKSQNKGQKQSIHTALGKDSGKNPLNAGQRRILEEERERVVKLYREMKENGKVGKGVEVSKEA